jgi:hypothetical protein
MSINVMLQRVNENMQTRQTLDIQTPSKYNLCSAKYRHKLYSTYPPFQSMALKEVFHQSICHTDLTPSSTNTLLLAA